MTPEERVRERLTAAGTVDARALRGNSLHTDLVDFLVEYKSLLRLIGELARRTATTEAQKPVLLGYAMMRGGELDVDCTDDMRSQFDWSMSGRVWKDKALAEAARADRDNDLELVEVWLLPAKEQRACEHFVEPCAADCRGPAYCPLVKQRGL